MYVSIFSRENKKNPIIKSALGGAASATRPEIDVLFFDVRYTD